ncbi:hypothetical protein JFPO14_contig00010-0022 [Edwardsiella piscicida]|nr:hypothetical protein JFPO14_contig00010-0022 [Edwardsiella piscicida]
MYIYFRLFCAGMCLCNVLNLKVKNDCKNIVYHGKRLLSFL